MRHFILSVQGCLILKASGMTWTAWPWRWKHYEASTHYILFNQHNTTSQKTWILKNGPWSYICVTMNKHKQNQQKSIIPVKLHTDLAIMTNSETCMSTQYTINTKIFWKRKMFVITIPATLICNLHNTFLKLQLCIWGIFCNDSTTPSRYKSILLHCSILLFFNTSGIFFYTTALSLRWWCHLIHYAGYE